MPTGNGAIAVWASCKELAVQMGQRMLKRHPGSEVRVVENLDDIGNAETLVAAMSYQEFRRICSMMNTIEVILVIYDPQDFFQVPPQASLIHIDTFFAQHRLAN